MLNLPAERVSFSSPVRQGLPQVERSSRITREARWSKPGGRAAGIEPGAS